MNLRKRTRWVDIVKGIALFFVIWGHAASGADSIAYRAVIYSFHFMLFFMTSGFFLRYPDDASNNLKGFLAFTKKNILQLMLPYLFWGIFFSAFSMINILPILYGSYQTIKTVNVIGALWYVPCFFLCRLFTRLLMMAIARFKHRDVIVAIAMVAFFAVGFYLPSLEMGYPWSFNIAFTGSGFLLLGYLLKPLYFKLYEQKLSVKIIVLCVSIVLFSLGTFCRIESLELVCMYKGDYGNKFWLFYNAITGATVVIVIAMLLSAAENKLTDFIEYLGTQTFAVMFLHVPVIRQMVMPILAAIGFSKPEWAAALVGAVITLALILPPIIGINRWCPQLFGVTASKNVE